MAVSLKDLIKETSKTKSFLKEVAKKSTPANNYTTVRILGIAQRLIDGITDYSKHFGYDHIGSIRSLRKDIKNAEKSKQKNRMYTENGMTGILNIGMRKRQAKEAQEDSILILAHPKNKKFRIALVADGMGGQGNGDLASNIATSLTMEWFENLSPLFYNYDKVVRTYKNGEKVHITFDDIIKQHLLSINDEIINRLGSSPGTTFSAVITRNKDGEDKVKSISLGDSKILRVSGNGEVQQLSKDDNLLSEGMTNGALYIEKTNPNVIYTTDPKYEFINVIYKPIESSVEAHILDESDVRFYNNNNIITGYLGVGQTREVLEKKLNHNLEDYITEWDFDRNDKIFLCSDGVSDNLSNSQIGSLIYTLRNSEECLRNIVNVIYDIERQKEISGSNNIPNYLEGNKNFNSNLKGSQDNISAVVVNNESEGR